MPFKIIRNDITKMRTQAIVNTANSQVDVGNGCDYAVYSAAGYEELLAYRKEKIGVVAEGESFITPAFALKAKYIIHTVSPLFLDGMHDEESKLRACYHNSLELAKENAIKEIAFPLISTGSFGYPKEEGMRIAVDEINSFLLRNEMDVYLVVFDEKATHLGSQVYSDLETYIDENYVSEKSKEEYDGGAYRRRNQIDEDSIEIRSERCEVPTECVPHQSMRPSMETVKLLNIQIPEFLHAKPVSIRNEEVELDECDYSELDFETEHENKLEERMKHLSDTFSQYLIYLIQSKNMENAEVYKRAIVDKKIFSKIKNNISYHPQKITALCLCITSMAFAKRKAPEVFI